MLELQQENPHPGVIEIIGSALPVRVGADGLLVDTADEAGFLARLDRRRLMVLAPLHGPALGYDEALHFPRGDEQDVEPAFRVGSHREGGDLFAGLLWAFGIGSPPRAGHRRLAYCIGDGGSWSCCRTG